MAEPLTREAHETVETYRRDTLQLNFTILDGNGAAKDLTGLTAADWGLFQRHSSTASVTKALNSGIAVTDAAAGEMSVVASATDMDVEPGAYEDELQLTIGSDVQTAAFGLIIVLQDRVT